jgi:hypothetical protein
MAALTVALAAIDALTSVPDQLWNEAPRQPVFQFLTGEAWDNMGSRRFLRDVYHFQCRQPVKCCCAVLRTHNAQRLAAPQ